MSLRRDRVNLLADVKVSLKPYCLRLLSNRRLDLEEKDKSILILERGKSLEISICSISLEGESLLADMKITLKLYCLRILLMERLDFEEKDKIILIFKR